MKIGSDFFKTVNRRPNICNWGEDIMKIWMLAFFLLLGCTGKSSSGQIGTQSPAAVAAQQTKVAAAKQKAAAIIGVVLSQLGTATGTATDIEEDLIEGAKIVIENAHAQLSASGTAIDTMTNTNMAALANLNQLNFFNVLNMGTASAPCNSNQTVVKGACVEMPYLDLAAGNGSITCGIRGIDSSIFCAPADAIGVTDPWNKAPFQPGTLTVGMSHICALSAADQTYYCWGLWDYTTSPGAFWNSFSCQTPTATVSTSVDYCSSGSPIGCGPITGSINVETSVCLGSHTKNGTRFFSTGNMDCEIQNNVPVCVGTPTLFSATELTDPSFMVSGYENPAGTASLGTTGTPAIAHGCMIHATGNTVSCAYNGVSYVPTLPPINPLGKPRSFTATHVAAGPNTACAYILTIENGAQIGPQIGCWAADSSLNGLPLQPGSVMLLSGSGAYSAALKGGGYYDFYCGLSTTNQVQCWNPIQPAGLEQPSLDFNSSSIPPVIFTPPLPTAVNTFTVGTGYVCTLDQTGTSGCWSWSGTPVPTGTSSVQP